MEEVYKPTKQEKEAILLSIEHWERDIIEPLRNGEEIIRDINPLYLQRLVWGSTTRRVPCFSMDCELCRKYYCVRVKPGRIGLCPYVKFHCKSCEDSGSPWMNFFLNPTLETACVMRDTLKAILQDVKPTAQEIEIEAIKKSIEHWENDIVNPLREGRTLIKNGTEIRWVDTMELVPCYGTDCELCKKYGDCSICPLRLFIGVNCMEVSSPWMNFFLKPNLENALNMVKALKDTLIKSTNEELKSNS